MRSRRHIVGSWCEAPSCRTWPQPGPWLPRRALLGLVLALAARPVRAQPGTVMEVLTADGRFTRFVALVQRASLGEMLRGPGPLTVLAPTDAAFAGAVASRIEMLAAPSAAASAGGPDPERLRAFVRSYILGGQAWTLARLKKDEQALRTEAGTMLRFRTGPDGGLLVAASASEGAKDKDDATTPPASVVQADIAAANGIIHALGGLIPR